MSASRHRLTVVASVSHTLPTNQANVNIIIRNPPVIGLAKATTPASKMDSTYRTQPTKNVSNVVAQYSWRFAKP
jgi:hypothetical protein